MARGGSGSFLKRLGELFTLGALGGLTDAQLLEGFAARRGEASEAAFSALVDRHGPMVLRVCRILLGDAHEAEDAFQATFLVLARRAGSIRDPELLGNWLYGVAHRTARKARARALDRRRHEVSEGEMSALDRVDRGGHDDDPAIVHREEAALVHEELRRLPERYRAVVVLCCLEGKTIEEAAERLRCSSGATRGRLARARARLRDRLARRGVAVSGGVMASALSARGASAALSTALRESTARAAVAFLNGSAAGAAPATVLALARRTSRSMLWGKLGAGAATVLALVALGAAVAGPLARRSPPRAEDAAEKPAAVRGDDRAKAPDRPRGPEGRRGLVEGREWFLLGVDPARGTISVDDRFNAHQGNGGEAIGLSMHRGETVPSGVTLRGLRVDPNARITVDGKGADLKALGPGMRLALRLAPDRVAVAEVRADFPIPPVSLCILEGVDVAKRTITVSYDRGPLRLETLPVAEDARVRLLQASPSGTVQLRGLDFHALRPGMHVSLDLEARGDGSLVVRSILSGRGGPGEERPDETAR